MSVEEEFAICGCRGFRHTRMCIDRGWTKMSSKEDVAADRKQAELEELREEAETKVAGFKGTVEQFAVLADVGITALQSVRGTFPIDKIANELRTLFGADLKPLLDLIQVAGKHMLVEGSNMRADQVKALMERTGLSEESCVAIVLATGEAVVAALRSGSTKAERTKK